MNPGLGRGFVSAVVFRGVFPIFAGVRLGAFQTDRGTYRGVVPVIVR